MIEIQIILDSCVKSVYGLTDDEYETLLKNFEGMKKSIEQQIKGYIGENLLQIKDLKDEINKEK